MAELASRNCLLIGPLGFYSFHQQLAAALEKKGYRVDLMNEEFPVSIVGRVMGKLALPLLRRTTLRGIRKRLDASSPYDLVLIIKGRGLGKEALQYLRGRARRIVGYNFDSFDYNPSPREWYMLADRYATFDIEDASRTGLPLVHLFSAANANAAAAVREYDLSIVQRVHSDRLALAERVLRALPPGSRPFVFFYESSILLFIRGFLRQPRLYLRMWQHISFKPLPYDLAMATLGASRVTFDYAHPKQSGITVRCFEAQSLGVAILTNNPAAVESGMFAPGTIAHFPLDADRQVFGALLEDLGRRRPTPRHRDIDTFLDELLDEH